jgi:hypothetical protein
LLKGARALLLPAVAAFALAVPWSASGPARAGMVATETLIESAQETTVEAEERTRVRAFVGRAEVRERLEALGVDPDEAAARAESLSDEEIALIAGKLDKLPAGTAAISLETLLVILIVVVLIVILI